MYFSALKSKNETPGMCGAGGKVNCMNYIQHPNQYQIWYQVAQANRNTSWQIQLHANIQSARGNLPLPDADHKFLQIYFIRNTDE